ncbi:hypothetical protein LKL35_00900 [Streptomyces sp. ET3-23]|uniref:hypothetical protein n=1 Tax=Streptomyces sp. ET3-23 TaxID=2885643 RepID=UPI001D12110F|nr:hypothetical protein [Streptomyces sp. ET3-23]MCC2274009.1 hypothetical protein [Streptomyces sp. ET3-23]
MIPTEASGISDPPGRQFPCHTLSLARGEQDVLRDARRLRHHVFRERTEEAADAGRPVAEADFDLSGPAVPLDEPGRGHLRTGGNCPAPGGIRRQAPVRGALPLGAGVCGPPGWSPRFGTAAVCPPHSLRRAAPARLQQLPDLARDF